MGRLPLALLAAAVLLAGCGGTDNSDKDPASQVPASGGLREKVRAAQSATAADFPATGGRTLQEVANSVGTAGPELGMATSVFTPGDNRVAFGMIDPKSGFVYGKTALYVAPNPVTKAADRIPEVGERMPKLQTDTKASARGDIASIDTRQPPDDMHDKSVADVVGKKPLALIIATPQLCQSRVCGPVVDIGEQMKSRYGKQVEFIHQEVYKNNDVKQGLRRPLEQLNLATEPWLFVVGKDGRITARLEGSFGVSAFEKALKTAL